MTLTKELVCPILKAFKVQTVLALFWFHCPALKSSSPPDRLFLHTPCLCTVPTPTQVSVYSSTLPHLHAGTYQTLSVQQSLTPTRQLPPGLLKKNADPPAPGAWEVGSNSFLGKNTNHKRWQTSPSMAIQGKLWALPWQLNRSQRPRGSKKQTPIM